MTRKIRIARVPLFFVCILMIGLVASTSIAQQADPGEIANRKVEDYLRQANEHGKGNHGFAAAVWADGKIAWSNQWGLSNKESGEAVDSETLFRIGSVTKVVTAAALCSMVDDGVLDLDRPLVDFLPETPEHLHPITPRQLAGHLSGIRHYPEKGQMHELLINDQYDGHLLGMKLFQDDPLNSQPGEKYQYSTHGYTALGAIMEKAGQGSFVDILRSRVLDPSGMQHTFAEHNETVNGNLAVPYGIYLGNEMKFPAVNNSWKLAGGGLVSTPGDLARFMGALVENRIMSPASFQQMMTRQRDRSGEEILVGLGWRVAKDSQGRRLLFHGGSAAGGRCFILLYPEQKVGVALCMNVMADELKFDANFAVQVLKPFLENGQAPKPAQEVVDGSRFKVISRQEFQVRFRDELPEEVAEWIANKVERDLTIVKSYLGQASNWKGSPYDGQLVVVIDHQRRIPFQHQNTIRIPEDRVCNLFNGEKQKRADLGIIHEITHVLAASFNRQNKDRFYDDGLAVFLQHRFGTVPNYPDFGEDLWLVVARMADKRGSLIPLADAEKIRNTTKSNDERKLAYLQEGAFTQFLIERYGLGKYFEIFNGTAIEKVTGKSFQQLESEWESLIRAAPTSGAFGKPSDDGSSSNSGPHSLRYSTSQWLGDAFRSNAAVETPHVKESFGEISEWKKVWQKNFGQGYSSVIASGQLGFITFADGDSDCIAAFDIDTGDTIWQRPMGRQTNGHDGSDDGPCATPATDGEVVVAIGGMGNIKAFDTKTGRELWGHSLQEDFDGRPTDFGFVSSPLLFGDKVIVESGGEDGKCVLAFHRKNGELVWASQSDDVDMASPALAEIDGSRQVIVVAATRVFSLDLADGALLWEYPCETDDWATPLPLPNGEIFLPMETAVLVSCTRDQDSAWSVKEVWRNTELEDHSSFYSYRDGFIFGNCADHIVCLDAKSGKIKWKVAANDGSSVVFEDSLIFLDRRTGSLRFGTVGSPEFSDFRFEPFPGETHLWTPPTFAQGNMFLRNSAEVLLVKPLRR